MITEEMIHGRFAQPRARRIVQDTPIVPRAVAEAVWEEASVYLQTELPRAWMGRLAVRADRVYRRNTHFRDLMCRSGDAGRDWLWAFTRHWLAALIRKHRPDLHRRLPAEYNVGGELPLPAASADQPIDRATSPSILARAFRRQDR